MMKDLLYRLSSCTAYLLFLEVVLTSPLSCGTGCGTVKLFKICTVGPPRRGNISLPRTVVYQTLSTS